MTTGPLRLTSEPIFMGFLRKTRRYRVCHRRAKMIDQEKDLAPALRLILRDISVF